MGKGIKETFGMVFPSSNKEKEKESVSVPQQSNSDEHAEVGERLKSLNAKLKKPTDNAVQSVEKTTGNEETTEEIRKSVFIEHNSDIVRIAAPNNYTDVQEIADAIKQDKIVILNMGNLKDDVAQKIHQFILGVCCAKDILPKRLEKKMFLILPSDEKIKK